jgi:hypothetical protein
MLSLAKVLGFDEEHRLPAQEYTQEMLLNSLKSMFSTAPTSSHSSQPLTHILVSLEIAISVLRHEDSGD